jgi:hypothetical protein
MKRISIALIWTVALLTFVAARPIVLPPEEITSRKTAITRALLLLTEVIPRARANKEIYRWLEIVHIPKAAFEQSLNRVLQAAANPLEKSVIDFATDESKLNCEKGIEGSAEKRAAYVPVDERVIHLCARAFTATRMELAHLLLHEYVHVQGIQNECDAEAIAYLTLLAAQVPSAQPTYLERCQPFQRFLEEIKKKPVKG